MNAPVAPHHLTPELHHALGRVTLDEDIARSAMAPRKLTCAQRESRRSDQYAAGVASGSVVERGVQ